MKYYGWLVLALAGLIGVGGCAGSDNAQQTAWTSQPSAGLPVETSLARELGFSTQWVRSLVMADGQEIVRTKLLGDILVILERPRNVVTALSAANGELLWKTAVGGEIEELRGVIGDADNVYVNSTLRMYTLNRENGRPTYASKLDNTVSTEPVLYKNLAIFGGINGRVFAHDLVKGFSSWSYDLPAKIVVHPIIDGLKVFAADSRGNYAMLDAATGDMRWRNAAFEGIVAAPAIDRSFIIISSKDQSVYSLNSATGSRRWRPYRSAVPLTDPPVVLDRVIYQREPGIGLTAIDSNTGDGLWTYRVDANPIALVDEQYLMAYTADMLLLLDAETGKPLQQVPTSGLRTIINGPDESLILISNDARMMRLNPIRS